MVFNVKYVTNQSFLYLFISGAGDMDMLMNLCTRRKACWMSMNGGGQIKHH